jgi:hypothetical protein
MTTASLPLPTPLERAVAPLDRARRALLVGVVRLPGVGPLVARRDARLALQSLACVASAFTLTLLAPGALFVVGPALFGVAHVAADARYLVLRRELPRWWTATLVAGCLTLLASRALEGAFPGRWPFAAIEVAVGGTWALAGAAAGHAAAPSAQSARRALIAGLVLAALDVAAVAHPHLARLVFAHVHNVVAIALWVWLFRKRRRFALPALALLAVFSIILATGAALPFARLGGPGAARFVDESVFAWPPWMSQRVALGLGLAFVMLQAVHYAVWLAFIPQDDQRAEGTLSFRMSLRSLARDLPPWLLALTTLMALAVLGASFVDVHRTRQLYMSLAAFHGYLELAAGAFFFARGK